MVSNTLPFVGSNLGVEIFFLKRGNIRKGYVDIEDLGTSVYFVLRFEENFMQSLFDFQLFFVVKRILKALFSFIS